jgi:hypothetical protein
MVLGSHVRYRAGSPLSPILEAFSLTELMTCWSTWGCFPSETWMMLGGANAVKAASGRQVVHQVLTSLQLAKHPDKTFIGRIARGFDFSGTTLARKDGPLRKRHAKISSHVCVSFMSRAGRGCPARLSDYVRQGSSGAKLVCRPVRRYCSPCSLGPTLSDAPSIPSCPS